MTGIEKKPKEMQTQYLALPGTFCIQAIQSHPLPDTGESLERVAWRGRGVAPLKMIGQRGPNSSLLIRYWVMNVVKTQQEVALTYVLKKY